MKVAEVGQNVNELCTQGLPGSSATSIVNNHVPLPDPNAS
jgi:hypothetical protein